MPAYQGCHPLNLLTGVRQTSRRANASGGIVDGSPNRKRMLKKVPRRETSWHYKVTATLFFGLRCIGIIRQIGELFLELNHHVRLQTGRFINGKEVNPSVR